MERPLRAVALVLHLIDLAKRTSKPAPCRRLAIGRREHGPLFGGRSSPRHFVGERRRLNDFTRKILGLALQKNKSFRSNFVRRWSNLTQYLFGRAETYSRRYYCSAD